MTKVFISYSRKDKSFAQKLNATLESIGIDAWIDWDDIPPTADWRDQIEKGIENSDVFLFLLSPDSASSAVCNEEIDHAVRNGKRLIPLVARSINEKDVHPALSKLNWIFFREEDNFSGSLKKLEAAINTDLPWAESHRRLQVRALEWQKRKDRSLLLRGSDLREAEEQLAVAGQKDPLPTDLQRQYVLESRRGESRTRNLIFIVGGVVIVALAFLSVFAFTQRNTALRQAHIARGQALASASESQVLSARKNLDLLLAVEAYNQVADLPHADQILPEQALRDSLSQIRGVLISGSIGNLTNLTFSPDDRWLVVGGLDNNIRVWDLQNPSPDPVVLSAHQDYITSLAFTPDGKKFISLSADNVARIWSIDNLSKELYTISDFGDSGSGWYSLAFSPDGRWLAEGNRDSNLVQLRDMQNPLSDPQKISGSVDTISSVAFSPDGRWLAAGSFDNTTHLWDMHNLSSNPIILEGVEGERSPFPVAFSPDGTWLATGSNDKTIRFWNMHNLSAPPGILKGSEGIVYTLVFSPDSEWLATAGDDNAALVWNLQDFSFRPVHIYQAADKSKDLTFDPTFHWLAERSYSDSANNVRLWNLDTLFVEPAHLMVQDYLNLLAFSSDGNWLIQSSTENDLVQFWNIHDTKSRPLQLQDHQTAVLSPDGKRLVTVDSDAQARIWDMNDLSAQPLLLPGQEAGASWLAFSSDSKWLAIALAGKGAKIRIWNMDQPDSLPRVLGGVQDSLSALGFSPDGKWLAAGSFDNSLHLWNLSNSPSVPLTFNESTYSLAFSSDGRWLATGGEKDSVRIRDLENPAKDPIQYAYNGNIYVLSFSPDGKWLAAGGSDSAIYLWNMPASNRNPQLLRGHQYYIRAITFSRDSRWLGTGSDDGTARLWDMQDLSLAPIVFHDPGGSVNQLVFSPDGHYMATGSSGLISLWNLNSAELVVTACQVAGRNLTRAEWTSYFPGETYRATCPQWPLEEGQASTESVSPTSYRPSRTFYISILILGVCSSIVLLVLGGIYLLFTRRRSRRDR